EFTDTAGSIFRSDIGALAMADITLGCNPPANDRFCPDEPVRRNQMASFLRRSMGLEPIAVPARPTVTLAFTGDTLIHLTVTTQAARDGARRGVRFDFGPMVERVRPLVEPADLALCHLEVPLDPTSTGVSGYPLFNAPAEVADGLADIGFDGCSTASNHSLDQGIEGILDTLEVLERRGLGSAGMFADQQTAGAATRYRLDDLDVAHLSATFSLNGLRLPAGREWMLQRIVEDQILTAAADARRSGADFVILSLHCCTEYQTPPTPFQRQVARRLIGSPDIDLIVGHHAHVIQPVEQVGDEYIVYGLGNFLSGQQFEPRVSDGVVVYADISPRGEHWSVREISAAPTRVVDGSYRIVPVSAATASWHRTMGTLRALGVEVEAR
ncbi:MAG: CapA family protein, partial [Acidimicrobiia bacterium]|nr:CapA family protein [Acidimicrobiia bacterium]